MGGAMSSGPGWSQAGHPLYQGWGGTGIVFSWEGTLGFMCTQSPELSLNALLHTLTSHVGGHAPPHFSTQMHVNICTHPSTLRNKPNKHTGKILPVHKFNRQKRKDHLRTYIQTYFT